MKILKEKFYHASEKDNLSLDEIDFSRRGGEDMNYGLAVSNKNNYQNTEWSKRTHLYELEVEGKLLDLRKKDVAHRYSGNNFVDAIESAVKKNSIDIVYLRDNFQIITNKKAVLSFKKIR